MAEFVAVHPVLDVRDVRLTAQWFCSRLGFEPLFADDDDEPLYAGIGRGPVEIHLQWHGEDEWATMSGSVYRFVVDDPDALHAEYLDRDVLPPGKVVADTEWGTREFGLYDPDGNALFFYRDL